MGRIGYSKDFHNIEGRGESRMFDMIESTFRTMSKLGQLTWPLMLLFALPPFGLQKEFQDLGVALVDERLKVRFASVRLESIGALLTPAAGGGLGGSARHDEGLHPGPPC
jgi:hypothetical protein